MKKIENFKINIFSYFFIIIFFVLISFFGSIYQLIFHYDGHHHGLIYSMSEDFLSGKLPYKDFFVHYGFLNILINSFFLKIFKMSLLGLYFVSALSYSAAILLLTLFIKKYTNHLYACLLTVSLFLIHPFVYLPWPDYQFFFFITLSIYLLSINNKLSFFASGIFLSFGILEKEFFIPIYLFVFLLVILIYFFLKFKKLIYFKSSFYEYFFVGFIIPILFFILYLYINDLIPFYLKHLELPFIISDMKGVNPIIYTLNEFINLIKHSIKKVFFQPYWFFFVLIIFTNVFFLAKEVFLRKKKFNYQDFLLIIVSVFSLGLFLTAIVRIGVFKLATGTIVGVVIIFYLVSRIKSLDTRYILNTLIILYLVLGFEFGKSPSNLTYPNYKTKFKNNSNTIKFLKGKKITKSEWEQLLLFKSKIDEIKEKCSDIKFGTNLTNDTFYTILMKKNFQIINFIPWYDEFYAHTPKLFEIFDPNYFKNFEYLSNQEKLLIAVGDNLEIKNIINKDIYVLSDEINYDFYGHNSIQIFLPKNCKASIGG